MFVIQTSNNPSLIVHVDTSSAWAVYVTSNGTHNTGAIIKDYITDGFGDMRISQKMSKEEVNEFFHKMRQKVSKYFDIDDIELITFKY